MKHFGSLSSNALLIILPILFFAASSFVWSLHEMEGEVVEELCCDGQVGKPSVVVFSYVPGDCMQTDVDLPQGNGQSGCNDHLPVTDTVIIQVLSGNSTMDTIFNDTITAYSSFIADATDITNNGKFGPVTLIFIWDPLTGEKLQDVFFHTSCSEPLNVGDRYGSIIVQGLEDNNSVCGSLGLVDWTDAPDSYGTLGSSNGPNHLSVPNAPVLGEVLDEEEDGQPDPLADGDGADEDGLLTGSITKLEEANIDFFYSNPTTDTAYLCAWLDTSDNGMFEATEKYSLVILPGENDTATLNFGLLADKEGLAQVYLRVRISTHEGAVASPQGPAPDGEVEDHLIMVQQAIFPIELAGFEANALDEAVEINWSTLSELNNDYFNVERSADGSKFESIARVASYGNSVSEKHYQHLDENPHAGRNYYRLKQTDFDGSFSFSKIIALDIDREQRFDLTVRPNPFKNELVLHLVNRQIDGPNVHIVLYDLLGRPVSETDIPLTSHTEVQVPLDLTKLSPGSYFLKAQSKQITKVISLLKL